MKSENFNVSFESVCITMYYSKIQCEYNSKLEKIAFNKTFKFTDAVLVFHHYRSTWSLIQKEQQHNIFDRYAIKVCKMSHQLATCLKMFSK